MNNEEKRKLAESCGLVFVCFNCEGEMEFIGTEYQWKIYEMRLEEKLKI